MRYIDGIFYTYYWRNHVSKDASESFINAYGIISGMSSSVMAFLLFLITPLNKEFCNEYSMPIIFSPMLFWGIYFLYKRRYKKIIRQHRLYKNRKFKIISNLYPVVMPMPLFFYILIDLLQK